MQQIDLFLRAWMSSDTYITTRIYCFYFAICMLIILGLVWCFIIIKKKRIKMLLCKWILWKLSGSKILIYNGYHCGCCGRWVKEVFKIPKYKSQGNYWDTWGLCPDCEKEGKKDATQNCNM